MNNSLNPKTSFERKIINKDLSMWNTGSFGKLLFLRRYINVCQFDPKVHKYVVWIKSDIYSFIELRAIKKIPWKKLYVRTWCSIVGSKNRYQATQSAVDSSNPSGNKYYLTCRRLSSFHTFIVRNNENNENKYIVVEWLYSSAQVVETIIIIYPTNYKHINFNALKWICFAW